MTVSSILNRAAYAGNGTTTVFAFPYEFLAAADLFVILKVNSTGVETLLILNTDYTVSGTALPGGGFSSGTVTMIVAPATGKTLTIYRDPSPTQGLDLVENDALPAESLERSLDKLTLIAQRRQDLSIRSVRLTDGFATTFNTELPELLPANTVVIINPTADGFAVGPTANDIQNAQSNAAAAAASASAAAGSASSASSSASSASTSASQAAAAVASCFYRDVVYKVFADSPVTISQSDNGKLFSFNTTGGNIVVNLPTIGGLTLPFNIAFLIAQGSNTVTINRGGSDTIGGNTSYVINAVGSGTQLVADTDNSPDDWAVISFGAGNIANGSITRPKLAQGAIAASNIVLKTSSYTATTDDDIIQVQAVSNVVITLPAAATCPGKILTIERLYGTNTSLEIVGNASEIIDNLLFAFLNYQYETLTIVSDGTQWFSIVRKDQNRYWAGRLLGGQYQTSNVGATLTDFQLQSGTPSFVEDLNIGMGTVNSTVDGSANVNPGISFTLNTQGFYKISALVLVETSATTPLLALTQGADAYDSVTIGNSGGVIHLGSVYLTALINNTSNTSYNFKVQYAANGSSAFIVGNGVNGENVYWKIEKLNN